MSSWQERARAASEALRPNTPPPKSRRQIEEEAEREQKAKLELERRRYAEMWEARQAAYLEQWLRDTLGVTQQVTGSWVKVDGVEFTTIVNIVTEKIQVVMSGRCPHCGEGALQSSPLRDLAHVGDLLQEFKGHKHKCYKDWTEGERAMHQWREHRTQSKYGPYRNPWIPGG